MYRTFTRIVTMIVIASTIVVGIGASSAATTRPLTPTVTETTTVAPNPSASPGRAADQDGIAYGPAPYQLLDLRLPDPVAYPGARPVIVCVHSGGWIAGSRSPVPDVAVAQVARGYALVSIDYQLATVGSDGQPVPSFPGAIEDVKRAIRFVKSNAGIWDIDPRRVILMGVSAGGYLAAFVGATPGRFEPADLATTAIRRRDSSVSGIIDFVGPTDLETFERTDHPWAAPLTASFLGCAAPSDTNPLTCPDAIVREASVAPYVDNSDPPIFLAYGALDTLVVAGTQGEPLAQVWSDAHHGTATSTTYDVVEDAGHNLPFEDTMVPITDFVDRVSRGPSSRSTL